MLYWDLSKKAKLMKKLCKKGRPKGGKKILSERQNLLEVAV